MSTLPLYRTIIALRTSIVLLVAVRYDLLGVDLFVGETPFVVVLFPVNNKKKTERTNHEQTYNSSDP